MGVDSCIDSHGGLDFSLLVFIFIELGTKVYVGMNDTNIGLL